MLNFSQLLSINSREIESFFRLCFCCFEKIAIIHEITININFSTNISVLCLIGCACRRRRRTSTQFQCHSVCAVHVLRIELIFFLRNILFLHKIFALPRLNPSSCSVICGTDFRQSVFRLVISIIVCNVESYTSADSMRLAFLSLLVRIIQSSGTV